MPPTQPHPEHPLKRLSRRRFLGGAAALAPLLSPSVSSLLAQDDETGSPAAGHILFAGTQTPTPAGTGTPDGSTSEGIYAFRWDPEHGQLHPLGLAARAPMPTYQVLSPDRKVLFSCNETEIFHGKKSGAVSAYRIQGHGLTLINDELADGTGTTNIGIDRTGRTLLAANYTGGSASSFPVAADGRIGPLRSHFQFSGHGPNPDRQEAPHVHRATVSPGNRYAFFNDLGLDRIHIYRLDAATATLSSTTPSAWIAPAGSGPRSLRFHPNGRVAYCVVEMGSAVLVLDWHEDTGTLTTRQEVSLIPPGFHGRSQAAETAISRDGRFLYASDRYYDGLYSFHVDPGTGELHDMVRTPVGGKTPRYITLDPTGRWILAANQDSDDITVFARNPETGRLATTPASVTHLSRPQCLVFA